MIQIPPHAQVFVCLVDIDGRKGFDGLACEAERNFQKDPMEGDLFIFRNKRKTMISILFYDGQGYWLMRKRLSKGKFKYWPSSKVISPVEAIHLFWGLSLHKVDSIEYWRPLKK